jgi:cytochrome oxidase Cu insertion factor (SCO1/SenC/PrrC family)
VLAQYVHAFAKQVDGLSGPPNGLLALTRRYRVIYNVTKDSPGHPYTVMHANSVFFFDRAGAARLVTTSTDDVAGITDDVKRLLN